jgi:DNA modification methylase
MTNKKNYINKVFYKNAQKMSAVPDACVDLVVTSPPYFNVKDYSKDGYQEVQKNQKKKKQIGDIGDYQKFISELLKVWVECERVLKPNGKLIINTPLMPMKKSDYNSHYNRHIFDLNSDIQQSLIYRKNTEMFLYDTYIWNRKNTTKKLMFGSYPNPRNFYAQNTSEFVTVYVKDGKLKENISKTRKKKSELTQDEWVEFTKQIWTIAIPNKGDLAFGDHSALMPEEIVRRCVRLFTFEGDVVLDPFTGSGTTLKVAKELKRKYIGYEIVKDYEDIITKKLMSVDQGKLNLKV